MNKNIQSTLLLGNNCDYILFKTAISFAESGMNVWFVSSEAFNSIPENIQVPEKKILQLITFFYLKDYKDLLSHLNGIHLWHKIPNVIILSNFDTYCNLYLDNYNCLLGALIATSLLDSISVCAEKKQSAYLVVTCSHPPNEQINRLQVLCDMYFPHMIHNSEDREVVLSNIINYSLNKNQL